MIIPTLEDTYGGHDFDEIDDADPVFDDTEYWYRCSRCGGIVSGYAIEEGLWPAVVGLHCPTAVLEAS